MFIPLVSNALNLAFQGIKSFCRFYVANAGAYEAEAGLVALFALLGVPVEQAVSFALVSRGVPMLADLIGLGKIKI